MTQRQQEVGPPLPHLDPYVTLRREALRLMIDLQDLIDDPPTGAVVGRVDGVSGDLARIRRNIARLRASVEHGH